MSATTANESFPLHGTDIHIPSRGLGTFQVDPSQYPDGSVVASVSHALKIGYRHIDTALAYGWGSVERDFGQAIRESGVAREEIFIVTKLHNCFHAPEDVPVGMKTSVGNLGLDYVDLYLMHCISVSSIGIVPYAYTKTENYGTERYPDGKPVIDLQLSREFDKTWAAMETLVDEGKTKLIGVSNFSSPKLARLLQTCRIHPVVNQVELHPYFPQKSLLRFCRENKIHVTAYGPLGCTPVPYLVGRKGPGPLEAPTIIASAEKYPRTPAQIILSHVISLGVSVIPKSNSLDRIAENFDCLFKLDDADHVIMGNLMGVNGENAVRNLETKEYLGFDNYNEDVEEP